MSRSVSIMGLTTEAEKYLEENAAEVPSVVCPSWGHIISYTKESKVYETPDCWYGEGPQLKEYIMKDGQKIKEIIQKNIWDSGPNIFLCLEDESGEKLFEWGEEEMHKWV